MQAKKSQIKQILPQDTQQYVYRFPLTDQGIRVINSKQQLREILKKKYNELKGHKQFQSFIQGYESRDLLFPYCIFQSRHSNTYHQNEIVINANCVICTSYIQYRKPVFSQKPFQLSKICYDHLHVPNDKIQQEHYYSTAKKNSVVRNKITYKTQATCTLTRQILDFSEYSRCQTDIKKAMRILPPIMASHKKQSIICDQFKISKNQYYRILRSLFDDDHDITLEQLFQKLKNIKSEIRTLPQDFIDTLKMPDQEKSHLLKHQLPQVLLIITPQMKDIYLLYGQYMGFDLTFSLIREKPEETLNEGKAKEYLVGVFAGTSESRKIVLFGLVITKKQDTASYIFLFQKFFQIMKVCPQTIVSDQQLTIAAALKQLKEKGIFTGIHLLDMFHILKKFRKVSQNEAFQLFRQMMHAKTRGQYHYLLEKVKQQISNDEEVKILSYFDKHSDKYCYSQIKPSFVGIGISDAMNEKFHDIIKEKMEFQTKYVKAIGVILDIIRQRNNIARQAVIQKIPMQKYMKLQFLKRYRFKISFKMYDFLVAQISKTFTLVLIDQDHKNFHGNRRIMKNMRGIKYQMLSLSQNHEEQQTKYNNSSLPSIHGTQELQNNFNRLMQTQESFKSSSHNSDEIQYRFAERLRVNERPNEYLRIFKLLHHDGIFMVRKKTYHSLWECNCYLIIKSGMPCCHILKVMMHLNQFIFDQYIHPRWFIDQDNISKFQVYTPRRGSHNTTVRMRTQCLKPSPENFNKKKIDTIRLRLPMSKIQQVNEDQQSAKQEKKYQPKIKVNKVFGSEKIATMSSDSQKMLNSQDQHLWDEGEGYMKIFNSKQRDNKLEQKQMKIQNKKKGRMKKNQSYTL